MMRDEDSLRLYLPRLPLLAAPGDGSWIEELYWLNCGQRLLEPGSESPSEGSLLETCTMQKDGTAYRLQIRKGRLFSDGSEITARDVIDSLIAMASDPSHPTQLASIVRGGPGGLAASFKLHTRYRLEIFLKEAVSDLLDRLSLPLACIRRVSEQNLGAGEWMAVAQGPAFIRLEPHPHRPPSSPYRAIELRRIEDAPQGLASGSQPFAAIFPGTFYKAPPSNALSETVTKSLRPQLLIGFWLEQSAAARGNTEMLRAALQAFARQRSAWRKKRLAQLFFQHGFSCEVPSLEVEALGQGAWTLGYDPSLLASGFVEDLAAFAWHRWQIKLTFTAGEERGLDGRMIAFHEDDPSASFASLQRLSSQAPHITFDREVMRAAFVRLAQEPRLPRREQLLREWLQKMTAQRQFIPFARVPLLIHSNRALAGERLQPGTLRFSSIGRRLQQQRGDDLRQAHLSALGSAVQMLAHDIKRPFGMMESLLQLLLAADDPQHIQGLARSYAPQIKAVTLTIQEMITDILELGSEQELITEPVSPKESAWNCLQMLSPRDKRIALRYDWRHTLMVEGDRYKLSRIFSNIIGNALQATPDGGTITIGSREVHDAKHPWIEISIHNSGSFIPPEKRERIFDAFYTEGREQGTGLGLAIVKKFIHAHEGHIHCTSDPRMGTAFTFMLPASYKTDQAATALKNGWIGAEEKGAEESKGASASEAAPSAEVPSILMIDDDILDMDHVDEQLSSWKDGAPRLWKMGSAESALALAQVERFDMILLDYQLGEGDGLHWIAPLRRLQPHATIALHSHLAEPSLQAAALAAGADVFLSKPLGLDVLGDLLRRGTSSLPAFVLVEDDAIYAELWKEASSLPLLWVSSPAALRQKLRERPSLLAGCRALISDACFGDDESGGRDLLRALEKSHPSVPVFLCSHFGEAMEDRKVRTIAKEPGAIAHFLRTAAEAVDHEA